MGNCCSSVPVSKPVSNKVIPEDRPGKSSDISLPQSDKPKKKRTSEEIPRDTSMKKTQSRGDGGVSEFLEPKSFNVKPSDMQPISEQGSQHHIKRYHDKSRKKIIYNERENDKIHEKVDMVEKEMTSKDIVFLVESLNSHFIFTNLSSDELENVIAKMFYCSVGQGKYVFKQGDSASCFFILEKGEIQVEIDGQVKKTLGRGTGFGELALLYNAPRSASIKAFEKSFFWAIDRKTFRLLVEEITTKNFKKNRAFLDKVNFFKSMTSSQKDSIASALITQKFNKDQIIVSEGDQADSYYIIRKGKVDCVKVNGDIVRVLEEGDSFGETALYENTTRGLTVKASEDNVKMLALSRDSLQSILGAQINLVINSNWSRWALEKGDFLSKLTKIQVEKILANLTFESPEDGFKIMNRGTKLKAIYIVLGGTLTFGAKEYTKGSAFGENFLYPNENLEKYLENDLLAKGNDCSIALISTTKFHKIIGGSLQQAIIKNAGSHEVKMLQEDNGFRDIVATLKLQDLLFIKKLGEGQFGHVYLVKTKTSDNLYALKAVSKEQIVKQNLEKHTLQEKEVLRKINFKFIMRMYRTFRDDTYIYFLLSYVSGMELFDAIRKMELLENEPSQFYVGAMLLAVEYLHSKNIVYRDIKPENIMIDQDGYVNLIDMGTAKILRPEKGMNKTYTVLGTPHYMAPEILLGKGYGMYVDLWSIGITLYELMCGIVPFGEDCEDPYQVYDIITKSSKIQYPAYFVTRKNKQAKKIIERLLSRTPEARLGGSYAALKAHPWFETFDWDQLHDRKMKAPYVPPSDKLATKREIERISNLGIPVIEEIQKTVGGKSFVNPDATFIPAWEKEFEF